jgi:transcription antitermination factor NusG
MLDKDRRQWFVVHTKVRKEAYAQWQLTRRGIVTFLPWISQPSHFTVGNVVVPLFPSYLFAHADLTEQYWDLAWAPGVRRLVGFGEGATPVDPSIIAFLRERADPSGVVHAFPVFNPGDMVRIKQGPLAGLVGIIEHPRSGRGRVQVLMELLRRQTRVEVPEELLDRVV